MIDHLPECSYTPGQPGFGGLNSGVPSTQPYIPGSPCICPSLRACEQRVLAEREADGPWFRSVVHDCCVDKQTAYAAGLDAAREAVAALEPLLDVEKGMGGYDCCGCATVGYLWTDALAAIDALREEQK